MSQFIRQGDVSIQPVLLRRTTSNVPDPAWSPSDGERPITLSAPGFGGVVDPRENLVISDEDPGDYDNMTATHKRKTSGLPLEAEAIYNRASVKTSLEQITDEEEGGNMDDSSQMSELDGGDGGHGRGRSGSFGGGGPGGGCWSAKFKHFMSTPRGMLALAFVAMFLAYGVTRGPSSSSAVGGALVPSAVESAVPHSPDSKGTTDGEFHEEIVGTPMEHHTQKYNNILFYDSPDKMKPMRSKGPRLVDEDVGGGLHVFEDVCLTNNIDQLRHRPQDTALRGLIYFTEKYADNEQRCVPCSNVEPLGNWNDKASGEGSKVVGHSCGMPGLHAMFASSVGDWTDCILEGRNTKTMEEWHQTQSPLNVTSIHFFQKPTFLLQFNALDMEKSLFDMLLTYLPHWQKFMEGSEEDNKDGFPFDGVISHSLEGCLSHSHNWFCEVLHQMTAFGHAKEIPWESDENTLYCYTELYYNQVGYQHNLDHEGLVTRETFLNFRELLFRKFGLPRRPTLEDRLADADTEKMYDPVGHKKKKKKRVDENGNGDANKVVSSDGENTKIIFYDNKLGDTTIWNEMESLISKARELEKFQNIKFVTVNESFADMSVAQQAKKFNEADAIIMAHGKHMANSIFSVDGTSFVEVGCKVDSLISNPRFMDLVGGKYFAIERCTKTNEGDEGGADVCVICAENGDEEDMLADFTMTPEAFEKLIDDVVATLE